VHHRSLILLLLAGLPTLALAQRATAGRPGPRPLMPRDREIALARSAAPAEVSGKATVLILTDQGYVVAEPGSNGVTCVVLRGHPESVEPVCYDPEAAATILPIELRKNQLFGQGKSAADVEREVSAGLLSGRYRLPRRPAMTYMMSAGQVLYSDEGQRVGNWQPHLMLYIPYVTGADLGLGDPPSRRAALVVDGGRPLANIIVVVKDFVPVKGAGTASR